MHGCKTGNQSSNPAGHVSRVRDGPARFKSWSHATFLWVCKEHAYASFSSIQSSTSSTSSQILSRWIIMYLDFAPFSRNSLSIISLQRIRQVSPNASGTRNKLALPATGCRRLLGSLSPIVTAASRPVLVEALPHSTANLSLMLTLWSHIFLSPILFTGAAVQGL
jgi:hypothetical protein